MFSPKPTLTQFISETTFGKQETLVKMKNPAQRRDFVFNTYSGLSCFPSFVKPNQPNQCCAE
jgi:hypothetical protein